MTRVKMTEKAAEKSKKCPKKTFEKSSEKPGELLLKTTFIYSIVHL